MVKKIAALKAKIEQDKGKVDTRREREDSRQAVVGGGSNDASIKLSRPRNHGSSASTAAPHHWCHHLTDAPPSGAHLRVYAIIKMDITKFIVDLREAAFLLGDYNTYRAQLSRRLRTVRKKLGRATAKNAKYAAKAPVTAEDVAKNIEFVNPDRIGADCC